MVAHTFNPRTQERGRSLRLAFRVSLQSELQDRNSQEKPYLEKIKMKKERILVSKGSILFVVIFFLKQILKYKNLISTYKKQSDNFQATKLKRDRFCAAELAG